jgi:ATP-binding cassette subfamily B protein
MEGDKQAVAPARHWPLIRRLLLMVWRYRWHCLGVLGLQIVLMTMGLVGLSFVGLGVDYIRYALGEAAGAVLPKPPVWPFGLVPPADWPVFRVLAWIAVGILALAGVRSLLNYQATVLMARLVQGKVVVDLRSQVYRKLQRLSFRFFDAHASGTIINRVTGDVQMVRAFVDQVVVQAIMMAISLTVYVVYMVHIAGGLTAACLATSPLLLVTTLWFSQRVRPAYRENRELYDQQVRALTENLQGVQVVKGFFRQAEEIAKYRKVNRAVHDQKMRIFNLVSAFHPLMGMLTQINLVVLLAYGGALVIRYERSQDLAVALQTGLSIGQFLVFSGLLQQFSAQVGAIANIVDNMQQSLTGAERVFEILDAPLEIANAEGSLTPARLGGRVEFRGVTFSYREGEAVLRQVSLTAEAGQCVAILGATGAGKSTLLSLIPRFYDPDRGAVLVDGIDVRRLDLNTLRRHVGVVFQESFLFSNTVAANIAFGYPEATREQIERAARIAAAHDFIQALPQGYETVLAESGNSLSGGQRQRLAIARALLLEPSILILDDPTAAVDPGTEEEILKAMEQAMEGRTTFLITHRISALRRADKVVVLAGGTVVEEGTHEQLMGQGGAYCAMARIQAPDEESRAALQQEGLPS